MILSTIVLGPVLQQPIDDTKKVIEVESTQDQQSPHQPPVIESDAENKNSETFSSSLISQTQ